MERCCVGKDNWCAEEGGNVTTSQVGMAAGCTAHQPIRFLLGVQLGCSNNCTRSSAEGECPVITRRFTACAQVTLDMLACQLDIAIITTSHYV